MKHILPFLLVLTFHVAKGQDCNTKAANGASTYEKGPDAFVSDIKGSATEINKLRPNLSKAEAWIKKLLTGFTGAKLNGSSDFYFDYKHNGTYSGNFYQSTGIKHSSALKMRFFAYYCYEGRDQIFTEGESGSFIRVTFNNLFIPYLCSEVGLNTVNGRPVFEVLEKTSTNGRIDHYDFRSKSNVNDTVFTSKHEVFLIRNSDKPVFIAVSRKEYLEQLIKDIEASRPVRKKEITDAYESNLKMFEHQVKVYKELDKTYTAEKEAAQRKAFNATTNRPKLEADLQKVDAVIDGAIQKVREYQGKPAEWLSRGVPRFLNSSFSAAELERYFENFDKFRESKEDQTREQIMSINPAYFDKSVVADVPQLIIVHLQKGSYPHMVKVSRLLKDYATFQPLVDLLNGKSSVSPEFVEKKSAYRLNYLAKLDKLSPLVIPPNFKPSVYAPQINTGGTAGAAKFDFQLPGLSPKLKLLPAALTAASYKTYVEELHATITAKIKSDERKVADDYIKKRNLASSKDLNRAGLSAWLERAPRQSLYLYSKAVVVNKADAVAANNFCAFLIMGGLPERAVPILEYWNRVKPAEAAFLSNLGNAFYRLGDPVSAARWLEQCLKVDSLHPTANKILCVIYFKQGNVQKAKAHGTKSLTASHDQEVISILRQLDQKIRPGEIMTRFNQKEFPLVKRTRLPEMPARLDDMERFYAELAAEKQSIAMTIAAIESTGPKSFQPVLVPGIGALRVKAQYIIMDGMELYNKQKVEEAEVFRYRLKELVTPYNANMKLIAKKYADKLNKLEGGEAGDEAEITALELAKCNDFNSETSKYLGGLSTLVNQYAQRQEYISRKFYRDYANWFPYWMPASGNVFPSIQRDYLKDIAGILSEYPIVSKQNCKMTEPTPAIAGKLKEWEDQYCANFKGKLAMGVVTLQWNCNSWSVDGGEGFLFEYGMKYGDDGTFEEFTIGAGLGEKFVLGDEDITAANISGSVKEFIKIGPNKATGKWEVNDFGIKTEISAGGNIGKLDRDIKILDVTVSVTAGMQVGGVAGSVF